MQRRCERWPSLPWSTEAAMIIRTFRSGTKRGRIFLSEEFAPTDDIVEEAISNYEDDEDRRREPRLRAALGLSTVAIDAHHGIDPECARHLFVETGTGPVFACVVVPESWLTDILRQRRFIYETFSFQVGQGERLTRASTLAAFEAWCDRNFAGLPARLTILRERAGDHVASRVGAERPEASSLKGILRNTISVRELAPSPPANTAVFSLGLSSGTLKPIFISGLSKPGVGNVDWNNSALKFGLQKHS
jgi:hypothetical protein